MLPGEEGPALQGWILGWGSWWQHHGQRPWGRRNWHTCEGGEPEVHGGGRGPSLCSGNKGEVLSFHMGPVRKIVTSKPGMTQVRNTNGCTAGASRPGKGASLPPPIIAANCAQDAVGMKTNVIV